MGEEVLGQFAVHPSRLSLLWILFVHLVAIFVCFATNLSGLIQCFSLFLIIISFSKSASAFFSSQQEPVKFSLYPNRNAVIYFNGGHKRKVTLANSFYLTPFLISLAYSVNKKRHYLVIFYDSMSRKKFKQLYYLLRFYQPLLTGRV